MQKILISACLIGEKVRYDGNDACRADPRLATWSLEGRLLPICPEVMGGLPIPRPSSEIIGQGTGAAVLDGRAKVISRAGKDCSGDFIDGAKAALKIAKQGGVKLAILKENSPSCGSHQVYDGSFSGKKIVGMGVTAECLRRGGVKVFSENQLEAVEKELFALEPEED